MVTLHSKLPEIGTTIFTVMSQLAQEHGAINLSQGFPDYPCHPDLVTALEHAVRAGHHQYAPMAGLPALRQAIADKLRVSRDVIVNADTEITITAGATQALYTAIAALLRDGDAAIVLDPSYDSYAPAIRAQGAQPVHVATSKTGVDWQAVNDAVTPRTRMVIVNNPNNPSTQVFSAADLDALADIAERHDLIVLADEVYEHLVFDGRVHHSVLAHPRLRPRSLAVYSFGKTFHATGWKVGYCVAAPELTQEFRKLHQYLVFCVNAPAQHALAEVLVQPAHWQSLSSFFQAKRDRLAKGLQQAGFDVVPAAGTYFQLAGYQSLLGSAERDMDDVTFSRWLTTEHGVASIPVSVFHRDGRQQQCVRFCFAKQDATLDAAIERLMRIRKR